MNNRFIRYFLVLLVIIWITGMSCICLADDSVTMTVLNVGKADCIILSAGGYHYMVDTGYQQTAALMLTALDQMHISHLDGVFITHVHKDHVGGLSSLAQNIPIDAFYTSAFCQSGIDGNHPVVAAAASSGQQVHLLAAGDKISINDDFFFQVLAPQMLNEENENDNSLVMALCTPHGNILLTGDMKTEEEYALIKRNVLFPCQVLKVPFHGDDSATSSALLDAVQPRISIISTSTQEEPDTPSKTTLRRLAMIGCENHVTQDTALGFMVTMLDGIPSIQELQWDLPALPDCLTAEIILKTDELILTNYGNEAVSLNGFSVYSTHGEELFVLPDGLAVLPHSKFTFTSSISSEHGDFCLQSEKRIWHKSKLDNAILYDHFGRIVTTASNGK